MDSYDVVIVGGGEAGVGAALNLRSWGFTGSVLLIAGEAEAYHRPPLSKGFIEGTEGREALHSASDADFAQMDLHTRFGARVTAIDRSRKVVLTDEGDVGYGHLVLATGARNRSLTDRDLTGLVQLRTVDDGQRLRDALRAHSSIVVIGAGFLGLEVASVAADLGLDVEVVEFAQAPLGGKVSAPTVQAIESYLRSCGIRFSLGVGVSEFLEEDRALTGLVLSDGRVIETSLALACIGVVPEVALAEAAGLKIGNGIETDEYLVTSDPDISAIGDCASYPTRDGSRLRVESIANALGQADAVARRLAGTVEPYTAVPWFWSVYGPHRMEIVGVRNQVDEVIVHGSPLDHDFAAYCFYEGELVCFESLNRAREHMKMRRLFEKGTKPTPDIVGTRGFSLADWKPAPVATT
ncbi:NAD(P)/FAD-dependent oxidoreductase [Microbacterium sp.]|uniref:NAD(P)/FAD-dependent oxidoreductase n=1 Tax=Microbacterium sp. TaxID=51671 RepID=UPI0039E44C8B